MKRFAYLLLLVIGLSAPAIMAQEVIELRHTHYRLNVRAGAGLGYSVLGTVTPCDELHVIRVWDRWYQILYGEGSGFVAGWYTAEGEPHCDGQTTSPTTVLGARNEATGNASDGEEQSLDTFTGNKCYGEWDCGPGNTPESLFMWKTGWCAATISAGVATWTLQQCQAGLGLVAGQPSAPASGSSGGSGGSSSSSDDGDDDDEDDSGGGGEPGTPQCPPGHHWAGPPYNSCISSGF